MSIAGRLAALGVLALAACAPEAPAPFAVTETSFTFGTATRQSLPAITVARSDGAELDRDDWPAAEAAARAHCAERSAGYARLPPLRDLTEIRLEDGVMIFLARCTDRGGA